MYIHIWFILIYLAMYHEQKLTLINHEIFSLDAAELPSCLSKALASLTSVAIFLSLNWWDNVFFDKENSHKSL